MVLNMCLSFTKPWFLAGVSWGIAICAGVSVPHKLSTRLGRRITRYLKDLWSLILYKCSTIIYYIYIQLGWASLRLWKSIHDVSMSLCPKEKAIPCFSWKQVNMAIQCGKLGLVVVIQKMRALKMAMFNWGDDNLLTIYFGRNQRSWN